MSRCLPSDRTERTVRLAIGSSSSTRIRAGSGDSKRVTVRPASARWSVRAVRKIVSPSGMGECRPPV